MSNYTIKSGLKNATGANKIQFIKKNGLANLKSEVDKLDIDKLENLPSGWSTLKSKVDKLDVDKLKAVRGDFKKYNDVVKRLYIMNWLKKIMSLDWLNCSKFIKTSYASELAQKIDYDHKINEIEGKILSITDLATITELNDIKNKMSNVSTLFKKADDNTKISDIWKKYFPTFDYNKFTNEIVEGKMKNEKIT